MNAASFATGMVKASNHFETQRTRSICACQQITQALLDTHGTRFLTYLEGYGLASYERALEDRYASVVLNLAWYSDADYLRYVEQCFEAGNPIGVPPKPLKALAYESLLPEDAAIGEASF